MAGDNVHTVSDGLSGVLRWEGFVLVGVPLNYDTIGVFDDVLHTVALGCLSASLLLFRPAPSNSERRISALAAAPPLALFVVCLNAWFSHHQFPPAKRHSKAAGTP
nr:hypothetical protein [Arthrobacter sp. ISL-95]